MKRTLYLIDSINERTINSSLHITELLPFISESGNIETVRLNINLDNMQEAVKEINTKADIVFIIHDFTLWNNGSIDVDYGYFTKFLCGLWNNKNVFVFPTELASSGLIKTQFKANATLMTKIIVGSESFRKILIKVDAGLGVPTNKIKLISIPTEIYPIINNARLKQEAKIKGNVILIPGMIHPSKDYIQLFNDLTPLIRKYKYLTICLPLIIHSTVSKENAWKHFDKLQDYIEENKLQDYFRPSLDLCNKQTYRYLLSLADLVVFPHDTSLDMYNGSIIDALGMGKAIVASESLFTEDLVKKTGMFLYKYQNELSFYDACSVILENKELKTILEEQNAEYGPTLAYSNVAQQYINQIKRFKFSS